MMNNSRAARYYATPHGMITRKQANVRNRIKRKLWVMTLLGGARCRICGITDLRILEINHKFGGGHKEYGYAWTHERGNKIYREIANGLRGIDDLEALCRPCNALDHVFRVYPDLRGKGRILWSISREEQDRLIEELKQSLTVARYTPSRKFAWDRLSGLPGFQYLPGFIRDESLRRELTLPMSGAP
jgi:hypothetical protein